jgi:hypothetical protein
MSECVSKQCAAGTQNYSHLFQNICAYFEISDSRHAKLQSLISKYFKFVCVCVCVFVAYCLLRRMACVSCVLALLERIAAHQAVSYTYIIYMRP